jgi:hypothetical protein
LVFIITSLATSGSHAAKVCVADGVVQNLYNDWDGSNCSFTNYSYGEGLSATWSMASADTKCNQVMGVSLCSLNSGTFAQRGTPTESGQYCWCRMTAPRVGAWVFGDDIGSASNCSANCAAHCAFYVRNNAAFRAAVLGP